MSEHTFHTKPLPIFQVIEKLTDLGLELFQKQPVELVVNSNIGNDPIPNDNRGIPTDQLLASPKYLSLLENFKTRQFLDASNVKLSLKQPNGNSDSICYKDEPAGGTQIIISLHQNIPEQPLKFIDAVSKRFNLNRKAELLAGSFPEPQRQMMRASQELINDFATESARLSLNATQQVEKAQKYLHEKTGELDKRYSEKETDLETRYRLKADSLDQKEKEHAEAIKAFELRNNTVVRRDLLSQIQKIISEQKEVKISPATLKKRTVVHWVCGITMVAAAVLAGVFAGKVMNTANVDWRMFLPLSAGTLLFVSTGIFYIRWNDQWFRDHASAEFTNRKFAADILRASWLAELFFEWDSKKDTKFPQELMQGFARGLFATESKGSSSHPFDQIATVMKDFQSLRIGKTGLEVTKKETPETP